MAYRSHSEIIQEIVRLRRKRGISQQELGEVIGLDQSTVSRIEKGERGLAVAELADIAERLNVAVESILRTEPARVALRASSENPQVQNAVRKIEDMVDSFLYFKALTG